MTWDIVDRRGIAAELDQARLELHYLLDRAGTADFERTSNGTRWTNEQLLFHMVFGFMVVARLLPLVRVLGRLPAPVGRSYAWLLNAASAPFHQINYYGSCAAARVYNRRRMAAQCDRFRESLPRNRRGISCLLCTFLFDGIRSSRTR